MIVERLLNDCWNTVTWL